ncbi:MAG: hypothetical protein ABEJ02_02385 [Candidatus Paceibacteria bacterium]
MRLAAKSITQLKTTLREVFTKPLYWVVGLLSAGILWSLLILSFSYPSLSFVLLDGSFSLSEKLNIFISSYGVFSTSFTLSSQILNTLLALLVGVNISLLVYYLKDRFELQREAGMSSLSVVMGALGIGCSACGSVVLSSLFGVTAASNFLGYLPFGGSEFTISAILLIVFSNLYIARRIQQPQTCKIEK